MTANTVGAGTPINNVMSLPPPSSAQREHVLDLEGPRRRRGQLRLSAMGATISFEGALRTDLRIPLGTLQFGLVDRGSARAGGMTGRFPILKRLSATAVVPREQGIEGWLWTSLGGSALTVLGDPEDAPNAALLFTKPLGDDAVRLLRARGRAGDRRALAARRARRSTACCSA